MKYYLGNAIGMVYDENEHINKSTALNHLRADFSTLLKWHFSKLRSRFQSMKSQLNEYRLLKVEETSHVV
jgi:hypothetical protein